jgi:hypothetical protein
VERKLGETKQNSRNKDIPTLLFSDGQVAVAYTENALQPVTVHKLTAVTFKKGLKVSKIKRKQWLIKEEKCNCNKL